jgi:hypothetical protein
MGTAFGFREISANTTAYDFTAAFEYGLDLILDALERRRETS